MDAFLRYLEEHPSLFIAIGAIVSAIGTVATVWIRMRNVKKDRNELRVEVSDLTRQLGQEHQRNIYQEKELAHAREEAMRLRGEMAATQQSAEEKTAQLTSELEATRDHFLKLEANEKRAARLVKQMLKLEGRLWEKRLNHGTPKFQPLQVRRTPIISLLNLKGGVGKTTITAHLGNALRERGYRPLLVDLDLQGSLSGMFLPLDKLKERADEGLLLQHFFSHATHQRSMNLLESVMPILNDAGGLVATTDKMAYAELNLTMHWLLRMGKRDTRFLMRRALHQKRVTNKFDVVLLDCPPLINTGCVNALAASDYLLIPVTPSKKSAERVPQLLKSIRDLSSRINPHIQPLGIILNRTFATELTAKERDFWSQLQRHCQDQWGSPVYAFATNIRQTTEVRDSESEFTPPQPGSDLYETFKRLVIELEERVPSECRRTATATI